MDKTGRNNIIGDGDPLDICIITERNIPHGNLLLDAIVVGGLRMIDGEEADDKIIAVLKGDAGFGHMRDITEIPKHLIERLSHYFLTYKEKPFSDKKRECEITHIYNRDEAFEVINRSVEDYNDEFDVDKRELFKMIGTGLS